MFDPYHKWLGIPKKYRPPTLYQILGIEEDEDDLEVIDEAAIRQSAHIRTYQTGPQGDLCTKLLNEISKARTVLLNPAKRKQYDAELEKRRPKKTEPPAVDKNDEANAVFADLGESPSLVNVGPTSGRMGGKKPLRTAVQLGKSESGSKNQLLIFGLIGGGVVLLLAILIPVLIFSGRSSDRPPNEVVELPEKKSPVKDDNPPAPKPIPKPMPVKPKPKPKPIVPNPNPDDPIPERWNIRRIPMPATHGAKPAIELDRLQLESGQAIFGHMVLPGEDEVILVGETLAKYDLKSKKELVRYAHDKPKPNSEYYNSLQLTPGGKTFYAVHLGEPAIRMFDIATGQETGKIDTPPGMLYAFALSPDGKYAVSCSPYAFRIWDTQSQQALLADDKRYYGVQFSRDSKRIYAAGKHIVDVLDMVTKQKHRIQFANNHFVKIASSVDGDIAISYSAPVKQYGVVVLKPNSAKGVIFQSPALLSN